MSWPSRRTCPASEAPGTSSCIRLRIRRNVDLPHPEGPMRAVTSPDRISRSTSARTWWSPNHACTPRATRPPGRRDTGVSTSVSMSEVVMAASQGGGEEVGQALEDVPEHGQEDGSGADPHGALREPQGQPGRDEDGAEQELDP